MKRIICAILFAALTVVVASGSLAVSAYTLPEKMHKQVDIGSGIKGSLFFHGEGSEQIIPELQILQDVELQFRGLRASEDSHWSLYQAGDNEEKNALTELYIHDGSFYFRSDLLPGEVFSFPGAEVLSDSLLPTPEGNPSLASAFWRWFRLPEEERQALWNPVESRLSQELEMWVAQYASVTEVSLPDSGATAVDLSYSIPMRELKREIIVLLGSLMSGDDGQALLDTVLSREQKEVFANAYLDYYYAEAMDALDNDYDLIYTRRISTLGNPISSMLEMPLDQNRMKYQAIVMEEDGGLVSWTLRGEDQIITIRTSQSIDWNEISTASAWLIVRPSDPGKEAENSAYHAVRADLSHSTEIASDEENRDHQREKWVLSIERDVSRLPDGEDPALYPEEDPVSLELNLHYFSRPSQSSPTTLEIDGRLQKKDSSLHVTGQLKTASPWDFSPFDVSNATEFMHLSQDDQLLKLSHFMAAASEQLIPSTERETDQKVSQEEVPGEKTPSSETEQQKENSAAEPVKAEEKEEPEEQEPENKPDASEDETPEDTDGEANSDTQKKTAPEAAPGLNEMNSEPEQTPLTDMAEKLAAE